MAAAYRPQRTAAAQERFGPSHSTAAISKETSISVHLAEKHPAQARAHGGAANWAARRCGSKRLSPHSQQEEGETPQASGHQHHVEEAWFSSSSETAGTRSLALHYPKLAGRDQAFKY